MRVNSLIGRFRKEVMSIPYLVLLPGLQFSIVKGRLKVFTNKDGQANQRRPRQVAKLQRCAEFL